MREEHPIDNQFREALFGAEVQPPASVWAGVKGRRRRRGMAFWSRRRGLTIVTLFVALGAGAYWAVLADREEAPGLASQNASDRTMVTRVVTLPETTARETNADAGAAIARATSTHVAPDEPAHPMASEGPLSPAETATKAAEPRVVSNVEPASANAAGDDDVPGTTIWIEEVPPAAPAPVVLEAGPIRRMEPVHTTWRGHDLAIAPKAALVPPYVLPKSEWWLGVQVGWYDVRREWEGGSTDLRNALNASEVWTSTIGVGALVGRTWRSGWGFSVGAEHERSEQQFRYVDRTIGTAETIETMMVTLNTEIFLFDADTVITPVVNEHIAEGIDRRSVLRVPVEGHWRGSLHRWTYGLGIGLAGEFTRTTSNSILVEEADGRIASAVPESGELRDRYPTVLLGSVSADIGYLLNERWALWASPAYMRSVTAFGNGSDVFAQPERFGLRLRLSYTFNCSR